MIDHFNIEPGSSVDTAPVKFDLGQNAATPGAIVEVGFDEIQVALRRHHTGDWGELCPEDQAANVTALALGGRMFSVYRSQTGVRFYVITEADRSVTTALLPAEY